MTDSEEPEVGNHITFDPKIIVKRKAMRSSAKFISIVKNGQTIDLSSHDGQLLTSKYSIRIPTFHYHWSCDIFNECYTDFSGTAFIIENDTGITLTWMKIESFTREDCGASVSDHQYYWHNDNAQTAAYGFDK